MAALVNASRPYWLWVSRDDLGIPRGFYRCSVRTEAGQRTRLCLVGADGFILSEVRSAGGTVHRTWLKDGRTPCSIELLEPDGVLRVLEYSCR